jgi:glycosyltransferase involved in cell wall biosynthesis
VLISEAQGPIKVSVVVPVFNPGEHIAASVDSLLAQTMPADQLELIFVDDGSTDDTPALLDRLAREHPQIRVFHEPPSGWPGRPRNVGLEAALGEYVQFVDQDDWLGEEALSRLYAMARRNDSDIVIGKMIGVHRNVPVHLFFKSWDNATIHDSPIMDSLTPHKMFRRAFLLESGLRFPEGKRRLEDHVFVVAAYFAARRISVLSDYDCYFHVARVDEGNAARRPFDPRSYLANLSEALDVVDANTDPGPARDRIHRRWLRSEIVQRLRGGRLLRASEEFRVGFVREARLVVLDRFSLGVDDGLQPLDRLAAGLLRAGDLASLLELAEWEAGLRLDAVLHRASWMDGDLVLDVATTLVDGAGESIALVGGSELSEALPLPAELLEALAPALVISDSTVSLQLFARHRDSRTTRYLANAATAQGDATATRMVTGRLPLAGREGEPDPPGDGVWEIVADWRAFGLTFKPRVVVSPGAASAGAVSVPALVGSPPRVARLTSSAKGHVRLSLAAASGPPSTARAVRVDRGRSTASSRRRTTTLELTARLATDRTRDVMVQLEHGTAVHGQTWPAVLVPLAAGDHGSVASKLSTTIAHPSVAPGQWSLRLIPSSGGSGLALACPLTVTRRRSLRIGNPVGPRRVLTAIRGVVSRRFRALAR